ncbi:MAG TPA: Xaa-Pro peptidase family protein [Bryobacteraceae bacterium]|nr:Xaa-Pro peptidase family protein [Bryobacteraceae bacterium]
MSSVFLQRRRALRARIAGKHLSAILSLNPASWFYLTGYTGEAGALLVTAAGAVLATDGRFTAQAKEETSGVRVVKQEGSLMATVGSALRSRRLNRIGFDAMQLTVAQFRTLRTAAGPRVRWVRVDGQVEEGRQRKDAAELAQMRKAAILGGQVLTGALKLLKPGVREIEIAAEIDYQMRRLGASGPAFESIVAFGARSAHPHARPTQKRLRKNELVVLDLGAILAHYCSDITRTVFVGRAPARIRRCYQAVREAQAAAVAATQPGIRCRDVDAAARGVLARYRLDQYFVHSTGHGLGLEVHEEPRVARGQKNVLVPGNVITIEPGVYLPGVGGIRIEDDVAVHAHGNEVLTRVPRDFIEI